MRCPACGSTKFQKGPTSTWSDNFRCANGHIVQTVFGNLEVVGFQARGTKGVYGEPPAREPTVEVGS